MNNLELAGELLAVGGLTDGEIAQSPIWEPIPESPQERAYNSEADVIGFGGAAGGSKTWLILGFAFTKHKRTRIFRRNFVDLQDLIDDGDTILDGRASFVGGSKKSWKFDNCTVMLGYVEHPKDWKKYKGRRVDLMAFDEADQFPETIIETLSAWNGTTDPDQKVRKLLCFNPPDAEGEWLINYFGAWLDDRHDNPAKDGELRYYIRVDSAYVEIPKDKLFDVNGYELKKHYREKHNENKFYIDNKPYTVTDYEGRWVQVQSRTFFKSLVDDNPYAMQAGYDKELEMLPEPLKSQLRWGDFSIGKADDDWQIIPTEWITLAQQRHELMEKPTLKIRSTGVDPSRGGKDNFVIANLRGNYFDELIVHEGKTIPKVKGGQYGARLVLSAIGGQFNHSGVIGVDADGIGASVYDSLLEYAQLNVRAINSGSAGYGTDKSGQYPFNNLRSAMWWAFREALNPESGLYIALPPSRTLRNELRAPTYSTKTGKIQVEKKDDIRKRIGRSTDHADAVVYAWFIASTKKKGKPRAI